MEGNYPDIDQEIMDILLETNMDIAEILSETDASNLTISSEYTRDITLENISIDNLEPSLMTISLDNDKSPIQDAKISDGQASNAPALLVGDVSSNGNDFITAENSAPTSANVSQSPEGITSSTVSETPLLPPCRICGEKASGFHYGANTCEACKGFFRRCIVKNERNEEEYKCASNGKCAIVPGRRNACSACRYKKCLSVGMSKHAIKTGRYTYEKKTKDTKEVKQLQEETKPVNVNQTSITEIEMTTIVSRLVEIQRRVDPKTIFDKELILKNQKTVYKEYKDKIETFGTLPVVATELYEEIFGETGIDLDDRKFFMGLMAEKMDSGVKNMVQFLKALPDIDAISVEDQSKLIKGSLAEYWFIAKHKLCNPDLNVIVAPSPNVSTGSFGFHRDEIINMFKNTNIDEMFTMARSLLSLDFAEEEVAVVRGIVITFTDRYALEQPKKIEQIQWKLIDCLRWLSKRNNKNPEIRICKILDRLTALRNLTELSHEMNKERLKWPVMQKYPLLLEVMKS